MKSTLLIAATLTLCIGNATGQGKIITSDPLTGLPVTPASDSGIHMGNDPIRMPNTTVCKSRMQGDFYTLYNIKINAAVAWYSSHLSGFKKVSGYEAKRSQTAFFNSDGTIVIFLTGESGAPEENTDAYSVAYQRYRPGISQKTITGLTQGKFVCP